MSIKPVSHIPQSPRLLDQLREVLRYKHYSLRTEEAYLYWVKFFVRWHGRNSQVRHPREMGVTEVQQFLSMLTTQRNVSVSTHNQALSALLFLYREAPVARPSANATKTHGCHAASLATFPIASTSSVVTALAFSLNTVKIASQVTGSSSIFQQS